MPEDGRTKPVGEVDREHIANVPYGSNEIRLSAKQWLVVILLISACFVAVPRWWKKVEPFEPASDYRIPYVLSDDYWHYQRWMDEITAQDRIPMIGDSVIWGEYVPPDQTLAQAINQRLGVKRLANAGLNGTHPLALEGLVNLYCGGVRDGRVILHCNLLWMSSPEHDLQSGKDVSFNHPRLVPQLSRPIPSYKATADDRIGTIVDHRFGLRGWVHHLRIAHFENLDLPNWSLEHPYTDPISQVSLSLPAPDLTARHEDVAWFERGIEQQDFGWVEAPSSLQLEAFQRTVKSLRARGNSVFVIVGPFNEHLLVAGSQNRYSQLREYVGRWLADQRVPHLLPNVLPRKEFGDASHPLAAGYRRLAEQIVDDPNFRDWLSE
ncbi:MAG: hypothetical protein QGH33_19025 [Pirellulaceae bacterium]|jgi:hypothetical protein|nr:hypothetical protein [Pirellulaceae bacterium]HJN13701.1 hypothetical protein [Pirellulaceae bacterium]